MTLRGHEPAIWAAVFAVEYAKDRSTTRAIKAACGAIEFSRNCSFRAGQFFDDKETAMLREMLGEGDGTGQPGEGDDG
jgi:hypothetical protein